MGELFHIAERAAWEHGRLVGRYEVSTRGVSLAEQGFIHCSLRHQLRGVADAFFADADDLVLLVIDEERLTDPVRYEPAVPGGERYPHLYGPLPAAAVVDVVELARDADGSLALPDQPTTIG